MEHNRFQNHVNGYVVGDKHRRWLDLLLGHSTFYFFGCAFRWHSTEWEWPKIWVLIRGTHLITGNEPKLMLQRVPEKWPYRTPMLGYLQTKAEWYRGRVLGGTWSHRDCSWCRVIALARVGMNELLLSCRCIIFLILWSQLCQTWLFLITNVPLSNQFTAYSLHIILGCFSSSNWRDFSLPLAAKNW